MYLFGVYEEVLLSACEELLMWEEFKEHLLSLYRDIPLYVYDGLMAVFVLAVILLLVFRRKSDSLSSEC